MASTSEVLTLQFGNYSNYFGTHFWNLQEKSFVYETGRIAPPINHDVLYREGLDYKGQVTYTPRLLLCDLQGSLRSLPETGTLYGDKTNEPNCLWDRLEILKQKQEEKSEYLKKLDAAGSSSSMIANELASRNKLEATIKSWSDFSFARYHPSTVNVVKEYHHDAESQSEFDLFTLGTNYYKSSNFEEDFADKIRSYVEECDGFQGFHLITDATDGFAGMAAACLEHLANEYERKPTLVVPLFPARFRPKPNENRWASSEKYRTTNICLLFDALNELASTFVPMATSKRCWKEPADDLQFHNIKYNADLSYHTASILATAFDTVTLRHRHRDEPYHLMDLVKDLTPNDRKLIAASLCFPFSINRNAEFIECLDRWVGPLTKSVTPEYELGTNRLMQMYVLRGIDEKRLKSDRNAQMEAFKRCKSTREMLAYYVACNSFGSATHVTSVEHRLNVETPFPQFFDSTIAIDGDIDTAQRPESLGVYTVPVLAGLHNDSNLYGAIDRLHIAAIKPSQFNQLHRLCDTGLEADDYRETLDGLLDLRDCYEDDIAL